MNAPYADFYVIPLPTRRVASYRRLAQVGRRVFLKHGALTYGEYVGDDLASVFGGVAFPAAAKAKRGETVVAAMVGFRSRAHRDRVMKRVFADPALSDPKLGPMPFDPSRLVYGGFRRLV